MSESTSSSVTLAAQAAAAVALAQAAAAVALALGAAAGVAQAAPAAPGAPVVHVLNLSSSAQAEVQRDTLVIAFSTTRDGADAASVQSQLKQALDAALAEARKVAKPGQIDVQTGSFSMYPRHGRNGVVSGWQGAAELLVEGKDIAGISQLAGRINSLTLARVGYTLSREAREKVEGEVTAQAIARFRNQAESYARAFGYSGYSIREVAVNSEAAVPAAQPRLSMAMAMRAEKAAEEPLPTEAGKASVTASVMGSVTMTR